MERLKSHREFVAVLKRRRSVGRADIVVHYHVPGVGVGPDDSASQGMRRLGLAVSKSVGNAVTRNKVKRRFRVLAARHEAVLPVSCDIVLRAKPSARNASFASLDEQVASSFNALAAKAGAKHQSNPTKHTDLSDADTDGTARS